MKSFCIFVKKSSMFLASNQYQAIMLTETGTNDTSSNYQYEFQNIIIKLQVIIRYPYWNCNSMLVTKLLNHIESTIIENTDVLLGRKYIINIYMVFAHAKKSKNKKENRFEMRIIFIILICILLLFFSNKYILSKYRKRKIVQNKYLLPCNYFASMFT